MSIRIKLTLLLSFLFLTFVGNILLTFLLEGYGEERLKWVIHTHEVITESEKLISAMTDAETGQRGYLLSGDPSYLEPYYNGLVSSEATFKKLSSLTLDNLQQQKRLDDIGGLMKGKFEELKLTIDLRKSGNEGDYIEAIAILKKDAGKRFMDDIRLIIIAFKNEELVLLEKRKGDFRESRAYITTMVAVEILFFIFMGIITALFVRNRLFSPLALLLESTKNVEKGKKQNIDDILPNDEMGYLLSRFYQMSEKVYDKTAALTYDANHDALTNLRNRSGVDKEIGDSIKDLAGSNKKAAVLFIDLNKFKQLNDTLGHDAGDEILKETANRLLEYTRSDDAVFRLGGDEFVVVLKNITDTLNAKNIVENILDNFALPLVFQGNPIEISLSIGIAISPDDSTDSEEILKFSDIAMYEAKGDKENNYRLFDESMLKRESDV